MRLGLKDKKIQIYEQGWEENEIGEERQTWVKFLDYPVWAFYREMSAKEVAEYGKIDYQIDAVFQIEYMKDLRHSMAIAYDNKFYEITRIDYGVGNKDDIKVYARNLNHQEAEKILKELERHRNN